jgi:hypothetical protein
MGGRRGNRLCLRIRVGRGRSCIWKVDEGLRCDTCETRRICVHLYWEHGVVEILYGTILCHCRSLQFIGGVLLFQTSQSNAFEPAKTLYVLLSM